MHPSVALNRRILLANRPVGFPQPDDFAYEEVPPPTLAAGEFLVRSHWISIDPAMRGWMASGKSYIDPVAPGDVMRAFAAGTVLASKHSGYPVGMSVSGLFGMQDFAVSDGTYVRPSRPGVALPVMLGPIGLPGITAYFGLLDVGRPVAGETVVVSAAAGAVGSAVVQIARIQGCRVVGIAGGPAKCLQVAGLGADAVVDYKAKDFWAEFKRAVPDGIDVFFDNVGGETLSYALRRLNAFARVVICGGISQYNSERPQGPAEYLSLLANRARMQGFVYFDYADRFKEAEDALERWVGEGRLRYQFDVIEGLSKGPEALDRLFAGTNTGKVLLKIFDTETGKAL